MQCTVHVASKHGAVVHVPIEAGVESAGGVLAFVKLQLELDTRRAFEASLVSERTPHGDEPLIAPPEEAKSLEGPAVRAGRALAAD